jgi:hypothetical protein
VFFDCLEIRTETVIRDRPSVVTAKILTSRARVSHGFMAGGGPLEAILCGRGEDGGAGMARKKAD